MPVFMVEVTHVVPIYVPPQGEETRSAVYSLTSEIPSYQLTALDCDPAITVIREVRAADVPAFGLEGACPYGSNLTVEEILAAELTLTHREVGPRPARPSTDDSAAKELAARLCQPARLNKGLEYLREMGLPLDQTSTGPYLQWVHQDVQRECAEDLLGVEWKPVARCLTTIARKYLATAVDSEV